MQLCHVSMSCFENLQALILMNLKFNEVVAPEISLKAAGRIQIPSFQPDTNPTPQECAHRLVARLSRIQSSENGLVFSTPHSPLVILSSFLYLYDIVIPRCFFKRVDLITSDVRRCTSKFSVAILGRLTFSPWARTLGRLCARQWNNLRQGPLS